MFVVTAQFLKKYPVYFDFKKEINGVTVEPVSELEEASLFKTNSEAEKYADMLKTKLGIETNMSYSDIDICKVSVRLDDGDNEKEQSKK